MPKKEPKKELDYSPMTNEKAISIIQQPDGNYIGTCQKNGLFISVREGDPMTVLQRLITHP